MDGASPDLRHTLAHADDSHRPTTEREIDRCAHKDFACAALDHPAGWIPNSVSISHTSSEHAHNDRPRPSSFGGRASTQALTQEGASVRLTFKDKAHVTARASDPTKLNVSIPRAEQVTAEVDMPTTQPIGRWIACFQLESQHRKRPNDLVTDAVRAVNHIARLVYREF
jgi:hypothetical protein